MKGTVKWFNDAKGFGFIKPEGGGEDCFVHYSEIDGDGFRTLETGDLVEFEVQPGDKGPKATHVRIVARITQNGDVIAGAKLPKKQDEVRLSKGQLKSLLEQAAKMARTEKSMQPEQIAEVLGDSAAGAG